MPRYNSTFEEEFIQAAQQQGLIEKTAQIKSLHKPQHPKAPTPDAAKKALEENPRMSWQSDPQTLLSLYGLKPDADESMAYERNIAEVAHKGVCVLAPSYDKINGLVENINQRQDIILRIVNKTPDGNYTHHRYAQSDLMQSLVRTANHLDNQNLTELCKLADTCIEQLHAQAFGWDDVKHWFEGAVEEGEDVGGGALTGSLIGGAIGGIVGAFTGGWDIPATVWLGMKVGGVAGGLLAALFKTAPQAKNVSINASQAHDALQALVADHPNDVLLHNLLTATTHIAQTADNYANVVDQAHSHEGNHEQANSVAIAYLDELSQLDHLLNAFLDEANRGRYAPSEADWWGKLKTPITGIFGNEEHKAIGAVRSLDIVVKTAIEGVQRVMQELQSALAKTPSVQVPAPSKSPTPSEEVNEEGLSEEGLEEALKELSGL
jgi:hypothetical protein